MNAVAESYVQEALRTYNVDCHKATAVMIGAAAESLILEIRDTMVQRMQLLQQSPHRDLQDWRMKKVIDGLKREFDHHKQDMGNELVEAIEHYWPAFTGQIRSARNDAGHPTSIYPVTHETVHVSLLIFPELLNLANEIKSWILSYYVLTSDKSL